MENNYTRNAKSNNSFSLPVSSSSKKIKDRSHIYAIRPCPQCLTHIFGMPGGRDAVCAECGYKDPCCSD